MADQQAAYLWFDMPAREEIAGYCHKPFDRVVQLVGSVQERGGGQSQKKIVKMR